MDEAWLDQAVRETRERLAEYDDLRKKCADRPDLLPLVEKARAGVAAGLERLERLEQVRAAQ